MTNLFSPAFHDPAIGVQVGIMTVHRDGRVFFGVNEPSENTVVAHISATYTKVGQRVVINATCDGDIPDWLGERHRQVMLRTIVNNRRALEKEYYIRREEKITGKMRRYNRLA
jgi:hypothetical protein